MPYIKGNAIRGYLRCLVMRDFLERVGYKPGNLKLCHSLFSGGVLEASGETSGKLYIELRRIRDLLPPVSLLSTA